MTQAADTIFRYKPRGWLAFLPLFREGWAILMIASMNGALVATLAIVIVNPEHIEFPFHPLLVIWMFGMIVASNLAIFAGYLLYVDLELTQEQVIFHFSKSWRLPINLRDLHPIQIQARTIEGANAFRFADLEYTLYFVSSPNLPWYFRFAGLAGNPLWLTKRGFMITSWHENYEAFLDKMKPYEAQ